MRDATVIIGHAGGYLEMRLNRLAADKFTLEFFTAKDYNAEYMTPDRTQTFATAAEAWAAAGKVVGWE